MKKLMMAFLAVGLAAGFALFGRVAGAGLDSVLGRYPGSVRVGGGFDLSALREGTLNWQGTYQTEDELAAVRRWYAERLHVSPASDMNVASSDNCAWLTASKLVYRLGHTESVLMCAQPHGTRVVVTDSIVVQR